MTGLGTAPGALPLYAVLLCAAAAAVWLLTGQDQELRRTRLLLAGAGAAVPGSARPPWRTADTAAALWGRWRLRYGRRLGRELLCLPLGCLLAAVSSSAIPLVAAAAAVPLVGRRLRARALRLERERRAEVVIELCGVVAGELRAGRHPGEALLAAPARGLGERWPLVSAAARFGDDVPQALRLAARTPGCEGLTGVAACWQVAVDGGAGLAAGLDRVGAALRAERDQRERLRAQLAAQRAAGVVLSVLPVFVLLLGTVLGADPLRVLLHTPVGLGCLVLGGLLQWAGLAWTARVVRGAAPDETKGEG
ncbi:type II secretion system F family protein [Streptomyces sp. XD-27]|uniref:type II secretion system F family protein n=1 Tax=Streptomyces sp. XD-27 TaxID=3062779 RepID=UPI0026F411C8|nr:type II secretion system F family protein [Streptomyces sp. XD-27]WKX71751.1 type II secretion system F family protein [Streptomyces sp. XD-27]